MTDTFAAPLLAQYLAGYMEASTDLAKRTRVKPILQAELAAIALDGRQASASNFNAILKGRRPCQRPFVNGALRACRELYERRLRQGNVSSREWLTERNRAERIALERSGIIGAFEAHADHFTIQWRIRHATTVAQLGLPDVLSWREGTLALGAQQRRLRRHAIEMMRLVLPQLHSVNVDADRLRIQRLVVSLASHLVPGCRDHQEAVQLARQAATITDVHRLATSSSVDRPTARAASAVQYALHWLATAPHADSTFNFANLVFAGRRLPSGQLAAAMGSIESAIAHARIYRSADPQDPHGTRLLSAAISLQARLLAATGAQPYLREADRLHAESLDSVESLDQPYGLIYPVQRCLFKGDVAGAIRSCERALEVSERRHHDTSERAYSALLVQLTSLTAQRALGDRSIREAALKAVRDASLCYQYAHVFNAKDVRKALGRFGRPNAI